MAELSVVGRGDSASTSEDSDGGIVIGRRSDGAALATWTIPNFSRNRSLTLIRSKYFEIGGFDCRLLIYPGGKVFFNYSGTYCRTRPPCAWPLTIFCDGFLSTHFLRSVKRFAGDSQALPGYVSIYLQLQASGSPKWDCFASYRLSVLNQIEETKSITR